MELKKKDFLYFFNQRFINWTLESIQNLSFESICLQHFLNKIKIIYDVVKLVSIWIQLIMNITLIKSSKLLYCIDWRILLKVTNIFLVNKNVVLHFSFEGENIFSKNHTNVKKNKVQVQCKVKSIYFTISKRVPTNIMFHEVLFVSI